MICHGGILYLTCASNAKYLSRFSPITCLDPPGFWTRWRGTNATWHLLLLMCSRGSILVVSLQRESSPRRLNFNKSGHDSFNTWRAKGALRSATKQWHHLLGFWRMLTGSLMHSNINKSKLCPLPPLSGWISFYGELAGKEQILGEDLLLFIQFERR